MKPTRRVAISGCLVVLAVAAFLVWLASREVSYQGRSLSAWFELATANPSDWRTYGPAFRHFEEKGAVFLVRRLTARRPAWRDELAGRINRMARRFGSGPLFPLRDPAAERQSARRLLGYYERDAAEPLLRQLKRAPDENRPLIIQALGELGPAAAETVEPTLLAALSDPSPTVVYEAITALGAVQSRADAMASRLPPYLTNLTDLVRIEATYTLSSLPRLPESTLRPLMAALEDQNPVVRANAARALGRMGGKAAPAIPKLRTLLGDQVLPASRAVQALAAIHGVLPQGLKSECEPAVERTLDGGDDYFELMVLPSAAELDRPIEDLVPICARLLNQTKNWQAWEAVDALGSMSPRPPEAVELLVQAAENHPNGLLREKARGALEEVSPR